MEQGKRPWSGKKEHCRGPLAMFEDPVRHESLEVMNAVTVDAFEVIVVYSEDDTGSVKRSMINGPKRSMINGPKVFVPDVSQWLHVFKWHGSSSKADMYNKVPGALVFTKLRTIADQFYYNCAGVRTADDASLTIKIESVEDMLNSTHDPIGDFINGLLADMMNYGRYSSSNQLQELCDKAIKTRTEMRLAQEANEQNQRLRDMELKGDTHRGIQEREEEVNKQKHRLTLEAEAHAEDKRRAEVDHQEMLKQRADDHEAALKAMIGDKAKLEYLNGLNRLGVDLTQYMAALKAMVGDNKAKLEYLNGLNQLGVDLTQYMVACAERSPDKTLKINGAGAGP
eukprot:gene24146-9732_t